MDIFVIVTACLALAVLFARQESFITHQMKTNQDFVEILQNLNDAQNILNDSRSNLIEKFVEVSEELDGRIERFEDAYEAGLRSEIRRLETLIVFLQESMHKLVNGSTAPKATTGLGKEFIEAKLNQPGPKVNTESPYDAGYSI